DDFRNLDKHLLITAADIDGRGRVVFGRGYRDEVPISKALAASTCVPGLFRPHRIDDRFYVDGEVVRTLSIDLAVEAGADVVIVSNVYRPYVGRVGSPSLVHQGGLAVARQSFSGKPLAGTPGRPRGGSPIVQHSPQRKREARH
ncbi:MAG: patatin-like phospholipase family protein, partial [Deltaproteobacteria bacterium]|nr:patatin-like phospholipase family protein [Deltaproteobacteria bacterium]